MRLGKKSTVALVLVLVVFSSSYLVGSLITTNESDRGPQAERSANPLLGWLLPSGTQVVPQPLPPQQTKDAAPVIQTQPTIAEISGRMIIFTGLLSVQVQNVEESEMKVQNLAESFGGFVAQMRSSGSKAATITIRIPQAKFFEAVDALKGLGKVTSEEVSTQDVTEQYMDLKARLDNLKRQERRLQEILAAARTIDEILRVEQELSRVRTEIDRVTAQLQFIERRVELATITVTLMQPVSVDPPWPQFDVREVIGTSLRGFYAIVRALIILAFSAAPLAAIGVPGYYAYRRYFRP